MSDMETRNAIARTKAAAQLTLDECVATRRPVVSFFDARLPPRFWAKVSQASSGCWSWVGTTNGKGYGKFYLHGRMAYAHRVSYEAFVDVVRAGLQIDHLCRNRSCCNPSHLEAVTCAENIRRGAFPALRATRGWSVGSRNGRAKLTEAEAADIRARFGTVRTAELAAEFGVGQTVVRNIGRGRLWRHLAVDERCVAINANVAAVRRARRAA